MNITQARTIVQAYGYGLRKLINVPGHYNLTWNGRSWVTLNIAALNATTLRVQIEAERPNITLANCL